MIRSLFTASTGMAAQQLNIDPAVIAQFPKDQLGLQPG